MIPIDEVNWRVLKKARSQPSYFCEKLLGITPYYYQVDILDDKYQFKVLLMARQLGKTQTLAFLASHRINMFPGSQVGIIAQNEKRAKEIYNEVRRLQSLNPLFADTIIKDLQSELKLENGSRVQFFASGTEGKSIRGATLDLLLKDEADFIPDAVYDATMPTVSATDGDVVLSSTPNKPYSRFYHIFMDAFDARQKYEGVKDLDDEDLEQGILGYEEPIGREYGYVAYHYDYTHGLQVTNPRTGKPQTNMQLVKITKNQDFFTYEREFLAWWSEESGTFITPASLAQAKRPNGFRLQTDKFYVMGVDFGRVNDYTAIVVLEVNDERDAAVVVHTDRIRKNDWTFILRLILDTARDWGVAELVYDANNVGDMAGTIFASHSGQGALFHSIPVKMSLQKKTEIYQNMKIAINTGRLMIQKKHLELMKELAKIQADEMPSGAMKIHAPPGEKDDLVDSLALASASIRVPANIADASPINVVLQPSTDDYEDYRAEEYGSFVYDGDNISSRDFKPDYSF